MEQKVTPQSVRGLGNICDNFSEDDFTKVNADTILQENVNVNNVSLRCFRVQMKGTPIKLAIAGSSSLNYGETTIYGVSVKTVDTNTPVANLIVGLYVNGELIASSGRTNSNDGYSNIHYTPNVFGNVTLEFKVLPQSNYAMVKATKSVSISIGTVITVYSPYIDVTTNKQAILSAWVTTEDGSTIIDTTVSFTHKGRSYILDTNTTTEMKEVITYPEIIKGDSITFSYAGGGYYSSSTVTKIAGSDGILAVSTPPTLPGNNVISIPSSSNKIIGGGK